MKMERRRGIVNSISISINRNRDKDRKINIHINSIMNNHHLLQTCIISIKNYSITITITIIITAMTATNQTTGIKI